MGCENVVEINSGIKRDERGISFKVKHQRFLLFLRNEELSYQGMFYYPLSKQFFLDIIQAMLIMVNFPLNQLFYNGFYIE